MGILAWIVVGLIAGWAAGVTVRGAGFGILGDIVVGIAGALVGGLLASYLFGTPAGVSGINLESILVAFLGAVVLLIVLRLVGGGRRAF